MRLHAPLAVVVSAVVAHALILACVVVTLRGTPDMYKLSITFWGNILRPQEVSPLMFADASLSGEEDIPDLPVQGPGPGEWLQAIQVEKPELFYNIPVRQDSAIPRFSGERVFPVDADMPAGSVDLPPGASVDLHLRAP